MSVTKHEVVVEVGVRQFTVGACHTVEELGTIALSCQKAKDFIDNTYASVSPHWHHHSLLVEQGVRAKDEFAGADNGVVAKECRDIFKGMMEREVKRLVATGDWTGTKLPEIADMAYRKLMRAWEMGGSMLNLHTVSQCEKFSNERAKEIRAEKAEAHAPAESTTDVTELDLPADVAEMLPALVAALKQASDANKATTKDLVNSFTNKLNNVVSHTMRKLVDAAA